VSDSHDQTGKRGGIATVIAWSVGAFLVLTALYLLSMGPIELLWQRGYIPEAVKPVVSTIYSPVLWLMRRLPMFADILKAYIRLWTQR